MRSKCENILLSCAFFLMWIFVFAGEGIVNALLG